MELHGTTLAQSNRMRESTVTSTPSLLTPALAVGAPEASVAAVQGVKSVIEPVEPVEPLNALDKLDTLDKYDISLIACTD
jgi:hypothetical protein